MENNRNTAEKQIENTLKTTLKTMGSVDNKEFQEKQDIDVVINKQGQIWVLVYEMLCKNLKRVFIVPEITKALYEEGVNPLPSDKTVKSMLDSICQLTKREGSPYSVKNVGRIEKREGVKTTYYGYVCYLSQ